METTLCVQNNLHTASCARATEESLNGLSPKSSPVSSSTDPRLAGNSGMHEQCCRWCCENPDASHSIPSLTQSRVYTVEPETIVREQINTPDQYRLTLAIGGMTCASCTRTINENVVNIAGVHDVSVNLIENSATCKLVSDQLADIVCNIIEDCGYEAQIVNVEPEFKNVLTEKTTAFRTVALKIKGLSSSQCPKKVMSTVESMGDQVTVGKALTSQADPVLVVSYVPNPPSFSLRNIVAAIQSSNDPPYRVIIHHPPTLEYLTRTVQAREKRRMFFRLVFAAIAAIPTFILGVVYMSLVSDENPRKRYLMEPIWVGNTSRVEWALLFISTPVMFYSANIFHGKCVKEIMTLWRKTSSATILQKFTRFGSMNLLVSSGVSVAYFSSLALLIIATTSPRSERSDSTTYFDTVVFLTMLLLIGRYVELTSKTRTAGAITALSALQPGEALLAVPDSFSPRDTSLKDIEKGIGEAREGGGASLSPGTKIERVPVDFLEIGDTVCVPHGATPPADGTIVPGEKSTFDERSLTGESRLVVKGSGDKVYVGTINKGRMVHVRVEAIGGKTMLDNIIAAVREGQSRQAPIERVADLITSYFVPIITLLAILTWLIWLVLGYSGALPEDYLDLKVGGWAVWSLRFSIAVFVVACPCGIGLAAPTAFLVGLGLAANHGILARGGGDAFQEMSQIDVIVFDKTGTLTEGGEPRVSDFIFLSESTWSAELVKCITAQLESASSHPLARAIRQFSFSEENVTSLIMSNFEEVAGRGLKATFDNPQCMAIIGNEQWIQIHGATLDNSLSERLEIWKSEGKSVVLVAICDSKEGESAKGFIVAAAFAISDVIRPEAAEVVSWFQKQGIETWMLSGDDSKTACAVASVVGIPAENVIAGVLPHQKAEKIQQLQQGFMTKKNRGRGRPIVAIVGDGINDAPALAVADAGIAIGSGSDVAISSANFVLISSNLRSLTTLQDLSKAIINRVKFNFVWALMYNIIAVPVAAGALYPVRHARLDPVWASLAMALSSSSVVASSLLLKRYKAPHSAAP